MTRELRSNPEVTRDIYGASGGNRPAIAFSHLVDRDIGEFVPPPGFG